jgi:HSP20 family protein
MRTIMRWEPLRPMRRWDPFDELRTMQYEMDRLFNRVYRPELAGDQTSAAWMPSVESFTKDGEMIFRADLPGVEQKDLDVSVNGRELVIKGERKQEKSSHEDQYEHREIIYGTFERHFMLPENVKTEELKATFHNGILEIKVPMPAVTTARKIEIETVKEEKKPIEAEEKKAA